MPRPKRCITNETREKIQQAFKDDLEVLEDIKDIKPCSKRKLSDYQIFVGECLKDGDTIKTCATKWREKKGK